MKTRIINLWYKVKSSYWFIPSLMLILSVLMSQITIYVDYVIHRHELKTGLLYTGGVEGARAVLSTIASSMITVAGVVFSIVMVVLSIASSQFGPRIIWNFMNDRGNQAVLGTFIATYLYCLLVLRSVRSTHNGVFISHLSVTLGVALAILSLGVLIYFIHHVASSLQVNSVVFSVATDLDDCINRNYPKQETDDQENNISESKERDEKDRFQQIILSSKRGYLQVIDLETLYELADKNRLFIKIIPRPGDFITDGEMLAAVYSQEETPQTLIEKIRDSFIAGRTKTMEQDVKYGIEQITEIAVRALSPGINDPYTAMACIDRIKAAMIKLSDYNLSRKRVRRKNGKAILVSNLVDFKQLADTAFDPIRQYGKSDIQVSLKLLETIRYIAMRTSEERHLRILKEHAEKIHASCLIVMKNEKDRQQIKSRMEEIYKEYGIKN